MKLIIHEIKKHFIEKHFIMLSYFIFMIGEVGVPWVLSLNHKKNHVHLYKLNEM